MPILYKSDNGKGLLGSVRKRIHESVSPLEYSTKPSAIAIAAKEFITGKPHYKEASGVDRELFGHSLGQVDLENAKYWEESPYRPSNSQDSSAVYIRPKRNIINEETILGHIEGLNAAGVDKYQATDAAGLFSTRDVYDPLAKHTVGLGEDDKGRYVSIYDVFDLKNKAANKLLKTNPEIYDRFYYSQDVDGNYLLLNSNKMKQAITRKE